MTSLEATRTTALPRGRRSRVARQRNAWLGALGIAIVLAAWQLLSASGALDRQSFPSAWEAFGALGGLLTEASFWSALWSTLSSALAGLGILSVIATVVAAAVTSSRFVFESTWFLLEFLKPIPPVTLIPLGLLLWGPSPTMKITLITFGAIWPLSTQLIYGRRAVEPLTLEVARSYRLSTGRTVRWVMLPAILPYALTGLRISAAIAVVIAVVTEMIGGAAGLGQDIVVAQSAGNVANMYALIIATGLLGLLINTSFRALERPLLFWHPSQRRSTS